MLYCFVLFMVFYVLSQRFLRHISIGGGDLLLFLTKVHALVNDREPVTDVSIVPHGIDNQADLYESVHAGDFRFTLV